MKYEIKPPKYSIGDNVNFTHHNGNVHNGEIVYCETHYNADRYSHIYCINKEGNKRSLWISEKKIIGSLNS